MSANFDAYYRWLGIPPHEQPPHHYRLLGITALEADPEIISDAADRQLAHVRTYDLGPQAELSQKILNEIAAAKVCLLNPQKKAAYDRQLQRRLSGEPAKIAPPVVTVVAPSRPPAVRAVMPPPIAPPQDEAFSASTVDMTSFASELSTFSLRHPPKPQKQIGLQVWIGLLSATALIVACGTWAIMVRSSNERKAPKPQMPVLAASTSPVAEPKNNSAGSSLNAATAAASGRAETTQPVNRPSLNPPAGPPSPSEPSVEAPPQSIASTPLRDNKAPAPDQPVPTKAIASIEPPRISLDPGSSATRDRKVEKEVHHDDATSPPSAQAAEPKKKTDELEAQTLWTGLRNGWTSNYAADMEKVKTSEFNAAYGGKSFAIAFKIVDGLFNERLHKAIVEIAPDAAVPSECQPRFRRQVLLPLSKKNVSSIGKEASLVVRGKISFSFGACPMCRGTHKVACPYCNNGWVLLPRNPNVVYLSPPKERCPHCHGTGHVECEVCGPDGERHQTVGRDFESWDVLRLMKANRSVNALAPWNAVLFLSRSEGTYRCYVLLDDLEVKIRSPEGEIAVTKKGLSVQ